MILLYHLGGLSSLFIMLLSSTHNSVNESFSIRVAVNPWLACGSDSRSWNSYRSQISGLYLSFESRVRPPERRAIAPSLKRKSEQVLLFIENKGTGIIPSRIANSELSYKCE